MAKPNNPGVRLAVFALVAAVVGIAQQVISAKAGLVYSVMGRVSIEGSGRLGIGAVYRQLKPGENLFSEDGRAEVLLNPGAVLRIGEGTRIRMEGVELTDARVSIDAGSAVVTVYQAPKLDRVEIHIGGAVAMIKGAGVYRFDAGLPGANGFDSGAPWMRVFSGDAEASQENSPSKIIVKRGQAVRLPHLQASKFDLRDTDALQKWAEERGTPPPVEMMPPMKCFSKPANMAEVKDWAKDCRGSNHRQPAVDQ